jgi:hypothetical protein
MWISLSNSIVEPGEYLVTLAGKPFDTHPPRHAETPQTFLNPVNGTHAGDPPGSTATIATKSVAMRPFR